MLVLTLGMAMVGIVFKAFGTEGILSVNLLMKPVGLGGSGAGVIAALASSNAEPMSTMMLGIQSRAELSLGPTTASISFASSFSPVMLVLQVGLPRAALFLSRQDGRNVYCRAILYWYRRSFVVSIIVICSGCN